MPRRRLDRPPPPRARGRRRADRRAGVFARAREPVDPQARARARRRPRARARAAARRAAITDADVKGVGQAHASTGAGAGRAGGGALPKVATVDFAAFGPVERKPLSAHPEDRRAAPARELGQHPARHAVRRGRHHRDGAGARRTSRARPTERGIKLTPLAFVMRACVQALQEFPQFCASLDAEAGELVLQELRAPRLCGRHAERTGRAGRARCRPQGRVRARARPGRAQRKGARRAS